VFGDFLGSACVEAVVALRDRIGRSAVARGVLVAERNQGQLYAKKWKERKGGAPIWPWA